MLTLKGSLDSLTEGLQELTKKKMSGENRTTSMPRYIPASDFAFSPEVQDFLDRRKRYWEETMHVSVGMY